MVAAEPCVKRKPCAAHIKAAVAIEQAHARLRSLRADAKIFESSVRHDLRNSPMRGSSSDAPLRRMQLLPQPLDLHNRFGTRHSHQCMPVMIDRPNGAPHKRRNILWARMPKRNIQNIFDQLVLNKPVAGLARDANRIEHVRDVLAIPRYDKVTSAVGIQELHSRADIEGASIG